MVIEFPKPGVTPESPPCAHVTIMRDGNQVVAVLGTDYVTG
jgi:hypothetical protein